MKSKTSLIFLGLAIAFSTAGMNGGCGGSTYENIDYSEPNWLTDGRIMAIKSVIGYRTEGMPGTGYGRITKISHAEYIISMKDDGTDERTVFGGEGKKITRPIASPFGNYIAYSPGQHINIITADGTREIKSIDCGERINSFDWSPDETRLAFSGEDTKNLYLLRISDEVKTQIATSAEVVAWRVGERIAYEDSVYNKIWISGSDGSSKEVVVATVSSRPQISSASRIVFRGSGNQIKSINMDGTGEAVLFSGYEQTTLKLSFDNTKIIGVGSGQNKGTWLINIDGTGLKKLRD